ncbi:hypothetical protein A2303_07715 [Candidatus Falkowbacteria bacterium RIFOXYB2_FULL_47_14]|uniref:histidine kinase n=1 Tax=Candidatus Falkowbacteria bacterium RIFOXYA2_FULL_47_19 TaxID=1797994 RepID=A0A1F5SMK7_9BACT|nr:MAG: hypothetical protein A2227_04860 [Candidatus Falkowbacteria bacterium RIFOXYA2_FULL_47_19]OGF36016.1 MAG: hypothetical protein A2468_00565 [Candidatus Falkowbacteria bacterium RIFOXYC2_FULL_46_15]OGF43406.1 MAG: hypothetical protein A2303_07715 [Candidatus Falkowbacteria bacterium RIFOXYB2_FULL_47_14]
MSAQEHGPDNIELTKINLSSLLEDLCRAVSKQSADKKRIKIKINSDLPGYVMGNQTALEQMISNLLTNAVKYSPAGSVVDASVFTGSDKVILSVEDKGIGIPRQDIPYIFNPFFRSNDKTAREEAGAGLGLAIVMSVVKKHKAKISVKSILQKGTSILIHFPSAQ